MALGPYLCLSKVTYLTSLCIYSSPQHPAPGRTDLPLSPSGQTRTHVRSKPPHPKPSAPSALSWASVQQSSPSPGREPCLQHSLNPEELLGVRLAPGPASPGRPTSIPLLRAWTNAMSLPGATGRAEGVMPRVPYESALPFCGSIFFLYLLLINSNNYHIKK